MKFPAIPYTRVAKLITCVACKEPFTVAEDFAHDEDFTPIRGRTDEWRMTPNHTPHGGLRYHEQRTRGQMMPQARSQPILDPEDYQNWDNWAKSRGSYLNCPRCGADNRNWVYIKGLVSLKHFRPALIGLILCAIIAGIAAILHITFPPKLVKSTAMQGEGFLLATAVFVSGFIITLSVVRMWPAVREEKLSKKFVKDGSWYTNIPKMWKTGGVMLLGFALIAPIILFIFLPWGFNRAFDLLDSPPPPKAYEIAKEAENKLNAVAELPELAVVKPKLEAATEQFSSAINSVNLDKTPPLSQQFVDRWDKLQIDKLLILNWVTYVGLGGFLALILAATAVNAFTSKINGNLPKPIFFSVANMTRIVAWEAKKSLEIPGNMEHFQWTNVNRNDQGGITLTGLCRDYVPQTGDYDLGRKVRAQCYCINTDLWGRIVKTDVTYKHVPPAPYGPQGDLLHDSLVHELFRGVRTGVHPG